MPRVAKGPKELNDLLERVYTSCMKTHNNKMLCSKNAWAVAKNAGWYKDKDGKWKKK